MSMAKAKLHGSTPKTNWPKEWIQELKAKEAEEANDLKDKIKAHRELRKLVGFPVDGRDLRVDRPEPRISHPHALRLNPQLAYDEDKDSDEAIVLPKKRKVSPPPLVVHQVPSRPHRSGVKSSQSKITEHFLLSSNKRSSS